MRRRSPPPRTLSASICAAGDYQKPENAILQVCTPDYYARAVAAVRGRTPRRLAVCLFRRHRLGTGASGHRGSARRVPARGEAVADLALMQLCRGFVLSNSTYSWWAQYLAPPPDKQTWAPDKWYAHTKKTAFVSGRMAAYKGTPRGCARRRVSKRNRRRRLLTRRLKLSPQATDEGKPRHHHPPTACSAHSPLIRPFRATFPPRGRLYSKETLMPLFSIIIPVYNVQNYLSACVKAWSSSPSRATGSASLWTTAPPTKAARCATLSPPSCPA